MTAATAPDSKITYIIGHKNPDADCVCAAIAYASYKDARGLKGYVAARCGNSNARIDTILARFRQPLPVYVPDVTPRVRDVMTTGVITAPQGATCAEALELIDQHDVRILPIISEDQRVLGTVSVFQLGGHFIPRIREPKEMRHVHTSLSHITRALHAKAIHVENCEKNEDLYIRIGAMDVRSFGKFSEHENIPAAQTVIIVGDRWDIQQRSIQIGVRALVVTGNLPVDTEVIQMAKAAGVSLIISPYDSATTAWVIRTASTIERLIDRNYTSINADTRLSEVRKKLSASNAPACIVINDEGRIQGILTKTDLLKASQTRLILVDHNEMTQTVTGANEVTIAEIIDHHRLGALNTQQPILFINEPVGSTCTIIADLFRRDGLIPSPDIAGIMMSGIISDTLHLNSPTSTEKDGQLLAWLASIAKVDSKTLADTIFSSGSVILSQPPEKVIRTDFKIYEEDNVRFAVSQVEELGFANFWKHAKAITHALAELCTQEKVAFACLLVTDINTQNSLLLAKGSPDFISRISYAHVEKDEIFDLPGIVSRKKQLIPYITTLLKEMQQEGIIPTSTAA